MMTIRVLKQISSQDKSAKLEGLDRHFSQTSPKNIWFWVITADQLKFSVFDRHVVESENFVKIILAYSCCWQGEEIIKVLNNYSTMFLPLFWREVHKFMQRNDSNRRLVNKQYPSIPQDVFIGQYQSCQISFSW